MQREWDRLEGTPQRELLREVRARFLLRGLGRSPSPAARGLEVGPGPGRFTTLLRQAVRHLVLLDLSPAMLEAALSHVEADGPPSGGNVDAILGNARYPPLREATMGVVVALGNVVGFAQEGAGEVLEHLATQVAPGGSLLLETVSPVEQVLRFTQEADLARWRSLLRDDPQEGMEQLLRRGWAPTTVPPGEPTPREFRFLAGVEVARLLSRNGLQVVEQQLAAPLLGGAPELLRRLGPRSPAEKRRLLRWEEFAGRHPRLLPMGGHLLTRAVRPPLSRAPRTVGAPDGPPSTAGARERRSPRPTV